MTKNFFGKHWKLLVNLLTILALALFLFAIRDQLSETFNDITHVWWWILFLIIPLQIWKYDAQARLYRSLFTLVGNKFSYRHMFETSLELNFVNTVFPSGGVSGISYYGARMRSENVSAGKATLVQIVKLLLLFLSFELLLAVGLVFLAVEARVNVFLFMLTVSLSTLLLVGTVFLGYILGAKHRIELFHHALRKFTRAAYRVITKGKGQRKIELTKVYALLIELHENYQTIRGRWRELKKPMLFALLTNVAEILTIYVVYVAFGQFVNIGAIILAYSVANFAGFVSVLPGGVGIYEALMTTVLVAAGIPAALSLSVTIMFRMLSTLIQLPPGYYFYHRTLHKGHKLESENV